MFLEIISPEKTIYSGEVTSVAVPGVQGEFEMLNNHAPIVSTLTKGTVKILGDIKIPENLSDIFSKINSKETHLNISSGVVEMKENKIIILTD